MEVAYFSPFNPIRSGISDFSEELLPKLKPYMNIDIYTEHKNLENMEILANFNVYNIADFPEIQEKKKYDIKVFHVGNNYEAHKNIIELFKKIGGILELHDIALHHYLAEDTLQRGNGGFEEYIRIMQYCHGEQGKTTAEHFFNNGCEPPWENNSLIYTVNKHLVDIADAVIVHSDYAKQFLYGIGYTKPITTIYLHADEIVSDYVEMKQKAKDKLGFLQTAYIMGAFGFATGNKRIQQILLALNQYKIQTSHSFKFCIVGEVRGLDLKDMIQKLNLQDNVIITGFVDLETFKLYMEACDFCFNLRYPTQGESSASLHRMLGMGKPVFVTDIGSFQEYPDDSVIKIKPDENEIENIVKNLVILSKDSNIANSYSRCAIRFCMQNCDIRVNAQKYYNYFVDVSLEQYREQYWDYMLKTLESLNLNNISYFRHFSHKFFDYFD